MNRIYLYSSSAFNNSCKKINKKPKNGTGLLYVCLYFSCEIFPAFPVVPSYRQPVSSCSDAKQFLKEKVQWDVRSFLFFREVCSNQVTASLVALHKHVANPGFLLCFLTAPAPDKKYFSVFYACSHRC